MRILTLARWWVVIIGGVRLAEALTRVPLPPRVQTFLHNRLGGLQVMPPGSDKWLYIKVRARVSAQRLARLELAH